MKPVIVSETSGLIILFSLFCFAHPTFNDDSLPDQSEDSSEPITYKQQVEYVHRTRQQLLETEIISRATQLRSQAGAILRIIHDPSNNEKCPGDKSVLSEGRILYIVQTISEGENYPEWRGASLPELIANVAEICFTGDVVSTLFKLAKQGSGEIPSIDYVYDTLRTEGIISPCEPEFNRRKISLYLTGGDPYFLQVYKATYNVSRIARQSAPIRTLNEKIHFIILEVKKTYGEQRRFAQPQEIVETIQVRVAQYQHTLIPDDVIFLVIETLPSIEGELTAEKVIRQLEINFTRETQGERERLGRSTTASDVRTRAIEMFIIDPDAEEFPENRITQILSPEGNKPAPSGNIGSIAEYDMARVEVSNDGTLEIVQPTFGDAVSEHIARACHKAMDFFGIRRMLAPKTEDPWKGQEERRAWLKKHISHGHRGGPKR